MFGHVGFWQLLIVVGLVVLVFGSKRLPDAARSLGRSMRILKSEAAALKKDGRAAGEAGADAPESSQEPAPKIIQAAPGDVRSSRPVQEPRRSTES